MDFVDTKKRPASSSTQTPMATPRKVKKVKKNLSSAVKRSKLESDRRRAKTRVNIGYAFESWRELRAALGIKRDPEMAFFLLQSYTKTRTAKGEGPSTSTPLKSGLPPMTVSTGESDRDNFEIAGVKPLAAEVGPLEESFKSMELSDQAPLIDEEGANSLENSVIEFQDIITSDPSDVDYVPPIYVRAHGTSQKDIDSLPLIGSEEAVMDMHDREEQAEDPGHTEAFEHFLFPGLDRVVVESDLIKQPACITYNKNLMKLASFLQLPITKCHYSDGSTGVDCDGIPPFQVSLHSRGTAVILEWHCSHGHKLWVWNSQPSLKYGMQGGDFMLATNILLSGNNYAKVALLFQFMNIGMVAASTFYAIQDAYCVDAIKEFWEEKRNAVVERLRPKKNVVALADGRMDSPGHSAQYCTYTTMEQDTMDIISVVTVDKRQTDRKSVAMEKFAFIKTFDSLMSELDIKEIVTDAHVQIASLMHPERGRYKDRGVVHSLDVWHAAKNLTKKLHAAGCMTGQKEILVWMKDVVNHFWFSCQKASNREEFMNIWRGLLHHVCGEHEWALGRCLHGPLDQDSLRKEVIQPGSPAHEALSKIVLNRRWLKDLEKFLTFRTTSKLESFQNHILMYASKRFSFSPPVYEARTLLAALDYNQHNHRPVYVNRKGQVSQKRVYSKKSQRYSVHTVKTKKAFSYIPQLQAKILGNRLHSAGGLPRRRTLRPDDPRALGLLPGIVPPPTAELAQAQVARGQDMSSAT